MERKNCEILGLRVEYLATGPASGIPLIILHGWGSSLKSWQNVAMELGNNNIRTFIPDLPGFGETPEPPRPWGLSDYMEFVRLFARALLIQKFTLAGHSFGGQIAIGYAAQYPNNLNKLILISAARIVHRRKLKVAIFLILTKAGNLVFSMPFLSFLKSIVQKIWYKLSGERDYYRASKLMRKTMNLVVGKEMREELQKIKAPTLILWGQNDSVTPLADAFILKKEISKAELYVFPGENHDLNLRRPRELSQKIFNFMNEL